MRFTLYPIYWVADPHLDPEPFDHNLLPFDITENVRIESLAGRFRPGTFALGADRHKEAGLQNRAKSFTGRIPSMTGMKTVSQNTIIEVKKVFQTFTNRNLNYGDLLYAKNFPDWFIIHATSTYSWDWTAMLVELRRGTFFFVQDITGWRTSIVSNYPSLSDDDGRVFGEYYIQKLAAFASTLPGSESLQRSLQLDGFDVNKEKLTLVPLEGPVTAREEEDRLTVVVKKSGIPSAAAILKHMTDAQSLYADGKDHPSLNESRSLIQALIDGISTETDAHGKHSRKLPGGTSNRIEFLAKVGFFTTDEQAAFNSAWGTLSAGSHPGVPDREQARIGLVLALELGQLLLLKFTNWKANAYQKFS